MCKTLKIAILTMLFSLLFAAAAWANPTFFSKIPEGYEKSCNLCHVQPPILNDFGKNFKAQGFDFSKISPPAEEKSEDKETAGAIVDKEKPQITLTLPEGAARGEKTQLQAKVTAGGVPVEGAAVEFLEETDIFGGGNMSLGESKTDASGLAAIDYWPRAVNGSAKITAKVKGSGKLAAGEAAGTFSLSGNGPLVEIPRGLKVPFLGTWIIVLFVAAVWLSYAYVVFNAITISRAAGADAAREIVATEKQKQHA